MKVDELFGSLLTFKKSFDDKPNKRNKGVALQSSGNDQENYGKFQESIVDSISLQSK